MFTWSLSFSENVKKRFVSTNVVKSPQILIDKYWQCLQTKEKLSDCQGSSYCDQLYEIMLLYGLALNRTFTQDPTQIRNGTRIVQNSGMTFSGENNAQLNGGVGPSFKKNRQFIANKEPRYVFILIMHYAWGVSGDITVNSRGQPVPTLHLYNIDGIGGPRTIMSMVIGDKIVSFFL